MLNGQPSEDVAQFIENFRVPFSDLGESESDVVAFPFLSKQQVGGREIGMMKSSDRFASSFNNEPIPRTAPVSICIFPVNRAVWPLLGRLGLPGTAAHPDLQVR